MRTHLIQSQVWKYRDDIHWRLSRLLRHSVPQSFTSTYPQDPDHGSLPLKMSLRTHYNEPLNPKYE